MSIEADLRKQLTAALKAKDLATANVIRMLNTKVMERRTAKGFTGEVDDALVLDVIAAYKKTVDKAMEQYRAAGERGAGHLAELQLESDFCATFLPTQLGEDETRAVVRAVIAELGATDPKMAGRVTGAVMKQHKDRVDANLVRRIIGEELASSGTARS
jgi:hypothetical protein